jgi:hypothetical protein
MSIAIGIPTLGSVRWETTWSLLMAQEMGAFETFRFAPGSTYLDDARNHLVRWFLDETDCDCFLSLDSDISFMGRDIMLLESDILQEDSINPGDCVSGCYYNVFDGTMKPVAKLLPSDKLLVRQHDDPLMEVEGAGAGFLMFSRYLLEEMREAYPEPCPWFDEPVIGPVHYGEDLGICHRVREMGYSVYLDLRVQLSHYKMIRLSGPNETDSGPPPSAGGNR